MSRSSPGRHQEGRAGGSLPTWTRAKFHQTDNSTGATHDLPGGKRGFNKDYLTLMTHFGMEPRTIEVGASEQNGDVEALNGALKRRLEQHLLVRGSRDFETVEVYEKWIQAVLQKANELRCDKIAEERAVMRPLVASRLAEYLEEAVTVSSWSTISIQRNAYSVPSRLIGEEVRVRVYEDRLEVTYGGKTAVWVERLLGRSGHQVNYRHVIWSLCGTGSLREVPLPRGPVPLFGLPKDLRRTSCWAERSQGRHQLS